MRTVCREAWLLIHSLNKEWFRRVFNKFKEGAVEVEHGNKGQKKPSQKSKDCIAWLQFFVSCVGQYQPDNKTIHLPSCFTRLSVYQRMCEENESFSGPSIGISQFYAIWRDHFSHVLIPKVRLEGWVDFKYYGSFNYQTQLLSPTGLVTFVYFVVQFFFWFESFNLLNIVFSCLLNPTYTQKWKLKVTCM